MLIAYTDALETVDRKDFLQKVFLNGLDTENPEQVMRIDRAFRQFIACFNMISDSDFRLSDGNRK